MFTDEYGGGGGNKLFTAVFFDALAILKEFFVTFLQMIESKCLIILYSSFQSLFHVLSLS